MTNLLKNQDGVEAIQDDVSPERVEPHHEQKIQAQCLHLPNQNNAADFGVLKSDVSCILFYKHTA